MYIVLPKWLFDDAKHHGLIGYPDGFAAWMGFTVLVDGEKVPAESPAPDPDHVGWGCRGLGLDHRWQKSEFSDRRFCTKCGDPENELGLPNN